MTVRNNAGTGGPQGRVTVNLLPKAEQALDEVSALKGGTKTDVINTALIAYSLLHREQEGGSILYIKRPDGEMERWTLL